MTPRTLLRLYPRAWRERYQEEVLALIDESRIGGAWLLFDLARGCVGAWTTLTWDALSPRARQRWCQFAAVFGGWVLGIATTAILAAFLPVVGFPARWVLEVIAAFLSVGATWLLTLGPHAQGTGLARYVPKLTLREAGAFLVGAIVVGTLGRASHFGALAAAQQDWLRFMIQGAGACYMFQPVSLGLAALMWPRAFSDLGPDRVDIPRSPLGLGA